MSAEQTAPTATAAASRSGRPRPTAATVPQPDGTGPAITRQQVTFSFFQFTQAFHDLSEQQRQDVGRQLIDLIRAWEKREDDSPPVLLKTYSLAGIRADVDFMIWLICEDMDQIQRFSADLHCANLRRYVRCTERYLSQTKRSQYIAKVDPEHSESESRFRIVPGNRKYIFVYPFVKTRDWYLLSKQARQGIMDEHITVGTRYRSVKLNTTYSFGLDDQEFVVAFETDQPGDFLDLVQELRETESSRYTLRDTPIYTCVRTGIDQIVAQFGAAP